MLPRSRGLTGALVATTLALAACSANEQATGTADSTATTSSDVSTAIDTAATTTTTTIPLGAADAETIAAVDAALAASPAGCDPLDTRQCVLPFPSNATTVADGDTPTGRRVAFPAAGLPTNAQGVAIDPTAWNRNDGFSANTPILAWFADLDPVASDLPSWTDLGASLAPSATVALVDTSTGERIPLWVDIDPQVDDGTLLAIRPAVSLEAATTYAVGLHGLVDNAGVPLEPSAIFRAYRDRLDSQRPALEERRDDIETALTALADAGIDRSTLVLAWPFTTASVENTTAAIVQMRDVTLDGLGGLTPEFEITNVTERPEPGIGRFVEGTYSVPNWMTEEGTPGTDLNRPADGTPEITGVVQSPFACTIPDSVLDGERTAHAVQYGHGLLGSHLEVGAGNVVAMGNEHDAVHCATKWAGFSEDDVPTAISALQDFSTFPAFIDRQHQGLLNQLVLSRLMLADNGLITEPPFQRADGEPLFDTGRLFFDGNSQGAIMGMALAALSPDIERAVLGVVGMNYSTLLTRSVDFDGFETVLTPAYPDPVDRAIGIAAAQMLWDSTEGAGYVRHLVSDPLPNTPPKDVLMHVAFGDWQVSELTAMVAARTMDIPIHRPVTADGRSRENDPGWAIESLDDDDRSALVIWDSGSDPIPVEAVPPRTSRDPHADPRNDVEVRGQKAAFLFDGDLVDVCNGGPCTIEPR
jgi:hypothetical protein